MSDPDYAIVGPAILGDARIEYMAPLRGLAVAPTTAHHLTKGLTLVRGRQTSRPRPRVVAVGPNGEVGMPVYVFRCVKCNAQFEKTMTVAQREKAKPVCPECKGRKVVPVLGGFFAKTSRKS
jgi:putative FmdB family regulatory protein